MQSVQLVQPVKIVQPVIPLSKSDDNTCPLKLRPIDNVCSGTYPYEFETTEGNKCCYKKPKRFWASRKKLLYNPLSDYKKLANKSNKLLEQVHRSSAVREKLQINCIDGLSHMFGYDKMFYTDLLTVVINAVPSAINHTTSTEIDFDSLCKIKNEIDPTISWLTEQKKYVDNLSKEDKDLLVYYTHTGDIVINKYIENNYQPSGGVVEKQYKRLQQLIHNAPPLDKDIIVFKGQTTNPLLQGITNNIYTSPKMFSTSLSPTVSLGFAYIPTIGKGVSHMNNSDRFGLMCRIKIPKGYNCLWISNSHFIGEREILLPDKSMYYVVSDFIPVPYLSSSEVIFPDNSNGKLGSIEVATNDIVLIKT